MADAKVICLEQARADRMPPVRFHTIAEQDGLVLIDLQGCFTPAAARLYAKHLIERADAADAEARKR